MREVSEQVMAKAFALSNARGADLLARLGDFDVWRGDLASMRGDEPRLTETADRDTAERFVGLLLEALILARAIELLPPACRAKLNAAYTEPSEKTSPGAGADTSLEHTERMMTDCANRLIEIYESLAQGSADTEQIIPKWITERELAATGADHRR